jgi:hypothetical protein
MRAIYSKVDMSDYFFPKCLLKSDSFTQKAISLLKQDRLNSLNEVDKFERDRTYIGLVKNIKLSNIVSARGKTGIGYFRLYNNDKRLVGNLNIQDIRSIDRFIENKSMLNRIEHAANLRDWRQPILDDLWSYPNNGRILALDTLSSKEIRLLREDNEPICIFKCGLILTPTETLNYMNRVRKLTSVAHKNTILRALHGDIFTNERLYRFKLRQDPNCDRCGLTDTLDHRLSQCRKVKGLIRELCIVTDRLGNSTTRANSDQLERLFARYTDLDIVTLSLHAEALKLIAGKGDIENPKLTIKRLIDKIFILEKQESIKNILLEIKTRA